MILAPEEYTRLTEIEENYQLLLEANKRLVANKKKNAISATKVMEHFGITEAELEELKEPEIE